MCPLKKKKQDLFRSTSDTANINDHHVNVFLKVSRIKLRSAIEELWAWKDNNEFKLRVVKAFNMNKFSSCWSINEADSIQHTFSIAVTIA